MRTETEHYFFIILIYIFTHYHSLLDDVVAALGSDIDITSVIYIE